MKTLVIGLGNELLGDDGIGILAARELAGELAGEAEVLESNLSGIALLDVLAGYQKAIIIDAIQTRQCPPGTIIELAPKDLRAVPSPSPHYTGVPEMIRIARELHLDFPEEIKIMAVEIADSRTIGGKLSAPVAQAMNRLIRRVKGYVRRWVDGAGEPDRHPDHTSGSLYRDYSSAGSRHA
jgi:hydrogenase maturation protease